MIRDSSNFLDFLKDKYNGKSLFHHFAADQFIMNAIHEKYLTAKESNALDDNVSLREMPLFLLSPDDHDFDNALDIAIEEDKPANFERMIDMVKEFDDICVSRCLLNTFPEMIKN